MIFADIKRCKYTVGPAIKDVPESTIAAQLFWQKPENKQINK